MREILKSSATVNQWVRLPKSNQHVRQRLFCFPFGGGGASFYHSWKTHFPPEIELCPIQLPGREDRLREQAFTDLKALVETLSHIIEPYLTMPFSFFGHSMGAWIGFELARQLRREMHIEPIHLFVSGRRAPHIINSDPPKHLLPKSEFIKELRQYNGTPELVLKEPELMELFLPLLRADFTILETYLYQNEEPLSCSITCFGGLSDHKTRHDELVAWSKHTDTAFRVKMFPGDHFYLKNSNKELLVEILKELTANAIF